MTGATSDVADVLGRQEIKFVLAGLEEAGKEVKLNVTTLEVPGAILLEESQVEGVLWRLSNNMLTGDARTWMHFMKETIRLNKSGQISLDCFLSDLLSVSRRVHERVRREVVGHIRDIRQQVQPSHDGRANNDRCDINENKIAPPEQDTARYQLDAAVDAQLIGLTAFHLLPDALDLLLKTGLVHGVLSGDDEDDMCHQVLKASRLLEASPVYWKMLVDSIRQKLRHEKRSPTEVEEIRETIRQRVNAPGVDDVTLSRLLLAEWGLKICAQLGSEIRNT